MATNGRDISSDAELIDWPPGRKRHCRRLYCVFRMGWVADNTRCIAVDRVTNCSNGTNAGTQMDKHPDSALISIDIYIYIWYSWIAFPGDAHE